MIEIHETAPLQMTQSEKSLLTELLQSVLSDLRTEIVNTDSIEFKSRLRARKEVVLELLRKLS